MHNFRFRCYLFIAAAHLPCTAATAQTVPEKVIYTYDENGRLTGSEVKVWPATNTKTAIGYDAAGNRAGYKVDGSANYSPPSSTQFVVGPLNEFTIIPIKRSDS